MPASEPSSRYWLWKGLNPLGRAATVLMFLFIVWAILSFVLPWEPLRVIRSRQPSVVEYIVNVLLVMIDVPLAWTAWKALKSDRGRRFIIAFILFFMFVTFIEARIALQKEERWRPQTHFVAIYSLVFIQLGIGRKRQFPSGTPAPATLPGGDPCLDPPPRV